jgi:hypothetical protein
MSSCPSIHAHSVMKIIHIKIIKPIFSNRRNSNQERFSPKEAEIDAQTSKIY